MYEIWNRIWRKRLAPQDPSFFNLQKIAEGAKHTLIQARLARWLIDMAWWLLASEKSLKYPLHNATIASVLRALAGSLFQKFVFFMDRLRNVQIFQLISTSPVWTVKYLLRIFGQQ